MRDLPRVIGLQVQKLRRERRWSLEVAARELELTEVHLAAIEEGHGAVTLASLAELAQRLKVPVGELLDLGPAGQV